jgi:hypothetical protein
MKRKDFRVGGTFYTGSGAWVCTDLGQRVIVAVEKALYADMPGAPETVFDEYDQEGCSDSPDDFDTPADATSAPSTNSDLVGGGIERFVANVALAKKIADRYELGFHIANGTVTTHEGWKSEERAANDSELRLWRLLELAYHGLPLPSRSR